MNNIVEMSNLLSISYTKIIKSDGFWASYSEKWKGDLDLVRHSTYGIILYFYVELITGMSWK